MQSHQHARLRRINSYLMLLAVIAFVLQGISAVVARAAASAGVMPQPAEVMNGRSTSMACSVTVSTLTATTAQDTCTSLQAPITMIRTTTPKSGA